MKDADEFDRLHDEYLAFLDEGAGDYLQEHADMMAEHLALDAADTVPIVGINPMTAEPYIMTLAMVGYKEVQGENYQVSVAWYPQPKIPIEIMGILKEDEVDIEQDDIVAHLLRKRLAIVALLDDTDDADRFGWTQIMKEVQTGQRTTNFEDAVGTEELAFEGLSEGITSMLAQLLSGSLDEMTFGDLVRMLADAQDDGVSSPSIEVNEDFGDWDESFTSEWE
jgi:hypothetical protein|tara:strand:+ start:3371 stop:4039 length:669 start_codon:yes stop_codon:yes gene_type:complete